MDTGCVQECWTYTSRWSCRFSPTPGRSTTGLMPSDNRSAESPTPESCSNWGVLIAPPHSTTSLALTVCSRPFRR